MATQPDPESDPDPAAGQLLTLGEHLAELRRRLTISLLALLFATVAALVFAGEIMDYLLEPARDADPDFDPIFTELLGYVSAYIKVGLLVGVAGAMPVVLYQMLAFIKPGLTKRERRWVIPIVLLGALSFAGGGAFAFYIAWPPALDFLLNFGDDIADAEIRINNYMDMLSRFIFWTGLVFQMPLLLMGLGALGLVRARRLISWWRWAVIGAFLIAALITPSIDPVTQATVALPLIALYGLGVLLVWLVQDRGLGRPF